MRYIYIYIHYVIFITNVHGSRKKVKQYNDTFLYHTHKLYDDRNIHSCSINIAVYANNFNTFQNSGQVAFVDKIRRQVKNNASGIISDANHIPSKTKCSVTGRFFLMNK